MKSVVFMMSKCANPDCKARSRYLDQGRLIVANHPALKSSQHPPAGQTEYFWLCDVCSRDADLEIYIPRLDIFLGGQVVGALELSQWGCA